jgi:hypothetical protein
MKISQIIDINIDTKEIWNMLAYLSLTRTDDLIKYLVVEGK